MKTSPVTTRPQAKERSPGMNTRSIWSRILVLVGSIAMLVGALDPMEGSVVILPGSGLVALGSLPRPKRTPVDRLQGMGFHSDCDWRGRDVGAEHGRRLWRQFWTFNVVGSADSALSDWLVHGYLGAGVPALVVAAGHRGRPLVSGDHGDGPEGSGGHHGAMSELPAIVIGTIGALTIGGCIIALLRRRTRLAH